MAAATVTAAAVGRAATDGLLALPGRCAFAHGEWMHAEGHQGASVVARIPWTFACGERSRRYAAGDDPAVGWTVQSLAASERPRGRSMSASSGGATLTT